MWQKVCVTNFLYVDIYKRSDRAALGLFVPTLVFISTIIEVPHVFKSALALHVYAGLMEQTIRTESSWVLYISELR
jgi:hypothetical protein